MKNFWCVNCGHSGSFGFDRQRRINCTECDYDDLVDMDLEPERLPVGDRGMPLETVGAVLSTTEGPKMPGSDQKGGGSAERTTSKDDRSAIEQVGSEEARDGNVPKSTKVGAAGTLGNVPGGTKVSSAQSLDAKKLNAASLLETGEDQ